MTCRYREASCGLSCTWGRWSVMLTMLTEVDVSLEHIRITLPPVVYMTSIIRTHARSQTLYHFMISVRSITSETEVPESHPFGRQSYLQTIDYNFNEKCLQYHECICWC